MYLGNIVAVVLVLATVPLFASILRIPFAIIGPLIVVDLLHRGLHGGRRALRPAGWSSLRLVGYLFKKLDYPIAPLVLAMVLGDKAEDAFRQSMIMSQGSFSIFWSNPLVAVLFALGIVLLVWPMLSGGLRALLPRRAAKADLLTE